MMFKKIIGILYTVFLGCSSPVACSEEPVKCGGSFYIDQNFSTDEQALILKSANRLNVWMGYDAVRIDQNGICAMRKASIGTHKSDDGVSDVQTIGEYLSYNAEIIINVGEIHFLFGNDFDNTFQVTVMHEVLHSFGLSHIKSQGVMNAYSGASDFSDGDKIECIRVNACK